MRYLHAAAMTLAAFSFFALAGCADAGKAVLGAQHTFNAAVKAENAYAAQPFCGDLNAPKPPACADAGVVIKMDTYSREAQEGLDTAKVAVENPDLDKASVGSIVTQTIATVAKFAGLVAKYQGAPAPAAP